MLTTDRLLLAGTHLKVFGIITSGMLIAALALFGFSIPGLGDAPKTNMSDLGSGSSQPAFQPSATPVETVTEEMSGPDLVLPVYNEAGVERLLDDLTPSLRSSDTILVVSGNNDNELDLEWLQDSVTRVQSAVPGVTVYAMTAGIENVRRIRDAQVTGISGIVYDYENHFPNEPEFDYDYATTLANVSAFHEALDGSGLQSVLLPTGLPLRRAYAQKWNWDYAEIGQRVDSLIIQTQTYCVTSVDEFDLAVQKANSQHVATGQAATAWSPQVTVDPGSPNGVTPAKAAACAERALSHGHDEVMVWWSPNHVDKALEFLGLIDR